MSSKYALVSTVDTMVEGFPRHKVIIFGSEDAAIYHAAMLPVAHELDAS